MSTDTSLLSVAEMRTTLSQHAYPLASLPHVLLVRKRSSLWGMLLEAAGAMLPRLQAGIITNIVAEMRTNSFVSSCTAVFASAAE